MFAAARWVVETVFTAFVVPALLTPVVWLAGAVARRIRPSPVPLFEAKVRFLERAYVLSGLALLAGGLLAWAGVPVERGGRPLTAFVWAVYGTANLAFAALVAAMTSGYGSLPEGPRRDALFLRFMGEVCFQVVMTAGSFVLLYRLLRVVFHRQFPGLDIVPQGI